MKFIVEFIRQFVPFLHPVRWAIINGTCLLWSIYLLVLVFVYPDDPMSQDFVRKHYYSYDLITCIVWVVEMAMDVLYFMGFLGRRRSILPLCGDGSVDQCHSVHQCHTFQHSLPGQTQPQTEYYLQNESEDDEKSCVTDGMCCRRSGNNIICTDEECRTHSLFIEFILAIYFLMDSVSMSAMELREIRREDEHMTLDVIINAAAYLYITIRQYQEWKRERKRAFQLLSENNQSKELGIGQGEYI